METFIIVCRFLESIGHLTAENVISEIDDHVIIRDLL